jgi:hypothetical protein
VAQPGHCAYFVKDSNGWKLKNDVSGWGLCSVHDGNQYVWSDNIFEIPFMSICQSKSDDYFISECLRTLAKDIDL